MPIDERATLINMSAELGGLSGIVAPDAQTRHFLAERRGIDFPIEPWMCSDDGARYSERIVIDQWRAGADGGAPRRSGQRRAAQ
ncbi:MAG: aconitase family protein [Burkholderiaceae bacterium]